MPKIPTFQTQARPTAEVGAIKSNLQIDPTKTMAAGLSAIAGVAQDYYIKQRDNVEKLEAKKKFYEMKAEENRVVEKLKNNADEFGVVDIYNDEFGFYKDSTIKGIENKRVRDKVQQLFDLDQPETIYKLQKNAFSKYESQENEMYNTVQNTKAAEYSLETDPIKKALIKKQRIDSAKEYGFTMMMGKEWLSKEEKKIETDTVMFDTDKAMASNDFGLALNILKTADKSKVDSEQLQKKLLQIQASYKTNQNNNVVDSILENKSGFYAKTGQFKNMDGKNISEKDLEQGMVRQSQKTNANGQLLYSQPQIAEMSIQNNVTNPIHKEGINIGYNNLGVTGNTEYLKQGYKLFKIYSTQQGRNFMRGTMNIDKSVIEMYDRMDFAINSMKMTENQAIESLRRVQQNINLPEVQRKRVDKILVDKATASIVDQNWSLKEAQNVEFISDTITRMANTVYKMGGSQKDAIEYASNFVDNNYYLDIFENLVPIKTNRPSFHDVSLKFYIKELWDNGKINKEQNKIDDIIAVDIAPTQFSDVEVIMIINKKTRQPVTMFESSIGEFDENMYDAAVFTQKELHEKVYPLAQDDRFKKYQKKYIDTRDSYLAFTESANLTP